ncbi:MAG: hypothetical protein AB7R40_24990 [Nitrospiraceae bacterium]
MREPMVATGDGTATAGRLSRRLAWLLVGAWSMLAALTLGSATVRADEVDTAVEAFSLATSPLGFTPGPTEKLIIKALVRCATNKRSVLVCAREEALRQLPAETRPLATCMLQGRSIEACAENELLRRLPPETRGVAQCLASRRSLADCARGEIARRLPPQTQAIGTCMMSGASYEKCAAQEALRRMPAASREMAACLAKRTDIGKCAVHAAAGSKQRHTLDLIEKLKADGRSDLGKPPNGIHNIIRVAEGIKHDKWDDVLIYGGAEVYKVAAKIVLSIFLTPALQPLISPIVDTVVQNRVQLVANLIKGLKQRDQRLIGQAVTEAYLLAQVEIPCSVVPGDLREAVCGTIGKIIKHVGKVGGDAADLAVRLIKRPLAIPDTLWTETQGARERIAGKKRGCMPAPNYYAGHYVRCYHRGAYLQLAGSSHLTPFRDALNGNCRRYYDQCFFSNRFDGLCNPQRDMFRKHVDEIARGIRYAATVYAYSYARFMKRQGKAICDGRQADQQTKAFISRCEQALYKQMPVKGHPRNDSCGGKYSFAETAHHVACVKAVERMDPRRVQAAACKAAPR